jgi:hypothetical protein
MVTVVIRRNVHAVGLALLATGGVLLSARAEPVRNGNELALAYVEAKAPDKARLAAEKSGVIHTFRYLRITEVLRDKPEAGLFTFTTVEPSSDLKVRLWCATSSRCNSPPRSGPTTAWPSTAACRRSASPRRT